MNDNKLLSRLLLMNIMRTNNGFHHHSMKNILSIDGGGVRIYFPLRILMEIERRTNVPIQELFEYFTGVSAGSILVAMLLTGSEGKPKYSLSQLCDTLEKEAPRIFHKTWSNAFKTLGYLIGPTYCSNAIEECFRDLYGESTTIRDLIKPCCIISYDILNNIPLYFSKDDFADMPVWKAVRASTAAPTYFYPYDLEYDHNNYLCIDGGVITNNPSQICLLKALRHRKRKYYTFSMGTGYQADTTTHQKSYWSSFLPSYGMLYWSRDILNTLFNATSTSQIIDLEDINTLIEHEPDHSFYRVNIKMDDSILLDDIHAFPKMKQIMDHWIEKNTDEIDFMCAALLRNYEFKKHHNNMIYDFLPNSY